MIGHWIALLFPNLLTNILPIAKRPVSVSSFLACVLYLILQSVNLSGQLHGVPAEVVHGDGVVPVAEVVLMTRCLLLPSHAAHS